MSREKLVLEFGAASAPLRRAAIEEVVICRFGGIGPDLPRIVRITVEYDDPRIRPERIDPVNDLPPDDHQWAPDLPRTQLDVVWDLHRAAARQSGSCPGIIAMPEDD